MKKHQSNWHELFSTVQLSKKSLGFFVAVALVAGGLYYLWHSPLLAEAPINPTGTGVAPNVIDITLKSNGNLYLGSVKLPAEIFKGFNTYRYRYQVINQPTDFIDQLVVDVTLPQAGTEQTVGHALVSNGGASEVNSQLINPTTVEFTALGISNQAQLAIELEVPQSFVQQSFLFQAQQYLAELPTTIWLGISIGLPLLTVLLLLFVGLGRNRNVPTPTAQAIELPSRLPPAILGILWKGRLTSRELAATLLDLARRGHLIIRQVSADDFRFRLLSGGDTLNDYEQSLIEQIFGADADRANTEEISFGLAQEVFSKRVSQAFLLAYKKVSDLGYFYTNPLALHRRYQIIGILLFILGAAGFGANLLFITTVRYSLFFWVGMMAAALAVTYLAKSLPVRTVYGDREIGRWLAFRSYLTAKEPINYVAHSQEQFLAYLPYAVVLDVEREWTRRFFHLPFAQPSWYVAPNVSTIDDFTNQIFPLFGYLSHALALTAQPAAQ
ncbi:MAG TPA: DUF2207 domain-containing protein [Candidatus Saccharimonadales bacterium]|nr:DUF2207 domain-containing protein [Candidatus Saccharimonadales bacterium]